MLTIGPLNELPRVRHAFFTRRGGVSEGIYRSLNCGFGSDDERNRVAENRSRAMARIDLEAECLVTAYQIHSDRAAVVESSWSSDERPRVDALVTKRTDLALGILSADCAPVLLADAEARVIGAAHAGWRGAVGGVLEAVVAAMEDLGAKCERILAGIGPCIAQRSYEVGPEFPREVIGQSAENADLFCPAPRKGHFLFDLKGYVARRLASRGIGKVQCLPCDTCGEEDRFFSYRRACQRGEGDYGRGLSVIYLES